MPSTSRSLDYEPADSDVPGGGRLACGRCRVRDAQEIDPSHARAHVRGLLWVAGAFLFCPCHLPLTLWLLAGLLAGTAMGAVVVAHPIMSGTLTTAVWLIATWHGMRLMKRAEESSRSDEELV